MIPMPIPRWHRDPQEYALEIQRASHNQALALYGEYTMFILLWHLDDFEKGLVERCSECWLANEKRAAAYGQSDRAKCPTCFGTTFEGGIKAKLVRLALWNPTEVSDNPEKRGEANRQSADIQSTSDFRLRTADYVFRADGTRWLVSDISTNHLRHGFEMSNNVRTPVAWSYSRVGREDESSVAYIIPPSPENSDMWDILNHKYPYDFSSIEMINGDPLHMEATSGESGSAGSQ